MPQLRWALLFLGVVFVILLAWIERRRQRQLGQGFSDTTHVEKEPGADANLPPMFREPALTLPEMRAARESAPPQELPVVEIEDDSLDVRPVEADQPRAAPPTLSLPVVGSGPELARRRSLEPTMSESELDSLEFTRTDVIAESVGGVKVPRLDKPAPRAKPVQQRINLADTHAGGDVEERAFNEAVFGDASLAVGPGIGATLPVGDLGRDVDLGPDVDLGRGVDLGRDVDLGPDVNLGPDVELARNVDIGPDVDLGRDPDLGLGSDGGAAPDETTDAAATSETPAPPAFTAADVKPIADPIVDWPPDDQRRVVALRLVAPPPERLAGRALRLALASEGFVLGKFQIFHKPDESGRAVLSAANLSKPGTFDLNTMDTQRYGGLSLFAVLPGPRPPHKAFDDLLATARNLNERLQGALQDERGGPLTPTRIASMRESLGGTEGS